MEKCFCNIGYMIIDARECEVVLRRLRVITLIAKLVDRLEILFG